MLAFFPGLGVGADISTLETKGIVQVLAEPNVMATNGKEASFLAGGEFPYPVVAGHVGRHGRGEHRVQGVWHPAEFHSDDHAAGNDPAAGGAGSERAGLHATAVTISGFAGAGHHVAQSEY